MWYVIHWNDNVNGSRVKINYEYLYLMNISHQKREKKNSFRFEHENVIRDKDNRQFWGVTSNAKFLSMEITVKPTPLALKCNER